MIRIGIGIGITSGETFVNRGPEILKVEVTVSGWYVKPRDAEKGKRET